MLQNFRPRDIGYTLADSSRTKEDIARLIENIRPHEELHPELRQDGPKELRVALMEHQKLGLAWLKQQEESSNQGSILADDMGLGKTIQALALILDRKSPDPAIKTTLIVAPVALMRQWQKEIASKVTSEQPLKVHIYHGQSQKWSYARLAQCDVVLTTYGTLAQERKRLMAYESKVLENPHGKIKRPELKLIGESILWYRVILDEAQAIKNRNALCSLGANMLESKYRLAMTGTPMMNSVQELYPIIRFLKIPPYHEQSEFRKAFKPLQKRTTGGYFKTRAMEKFQIFLKSVLLRRTKASVIDGKPIMNLKARVVEVRHGVFDEDQRAFYDALQSRVQLQFNKYLKADTVGKNYSNILVLLLRMRQACDHPNLIKNHSIPATAEVDTAAVEQLVKKLDESVIAQIKEANGAFECPICYDCCENPNIFFPCGHYVCGECFIHTLDSSFAVGKSEESTYAKCPTCRQNINPAEILPYTIFKKVHVPDLYKKDFPDLVHGSPHDSESELNSSSEDDDDDRSSGSWAPNKEGDGASPGSKRKRKTRTSSRKKIKKPKKPLVQLKKKSRRSSAAKKRHLSRLRKTFISSAKIDKTMELLNEIRENDPTEKTLIFSQFTSFLDLFEVPISESEWNWVRYDGTMSSKDRNNAVDRFTDDPACNIMLISLKAGNAGLNLNCASQVIILDPFWHPFCEEQAIDRAHRIGQMRDVHVHRILIEDTVESRIVELQERKRETIDTALDEGAARSLSRLGGHELRFLFQL